MEIAKSKRAKELVERSFVYLLVFRTLVINQPWIEFQRLILIEEQRSEVSLMLQMCRIESKEGIINLMYLFRRKLYISTSTGVYNFY